MAKQTFTAGQVLTAAEMNSLQENDYNWTVTTKTASYTLAAGDEGTRIVMDNAGATTITVDDGVFAAGDVVWIHNIGAGTCTVTAGTATVNTTGGLGLALGQYAGGQLYFTSASAALFFPSEAGGTIPYADASARTTAVPSPVEGQMSYLEDTNKVEVYDGSAWVGAGGGAWTAYTPSWYQVTVGNATQDFVYAMVGDIMFIEGTFELGSTSAVTGTIQMDLPSGYEFATNQQIPVGMVRCVNSGVANFYGQMRSPGSGSSTMELKLFNAASTYVIEATANATNPFSWGTGDQMEMSLAARVTAV